MSFIFFSATGASCPTQIVSGEFDLTRTPIYPEVSAVLGGQKVGFADTRHGVCRLKHHIQSSLWHLLLPGMFDVQAHELTNKDYVTLHGLGSSTKDNNTADVYLKLMSGRASLVVKGIGLAFEGTMHVIDNYINANTKI